MMYKQVCLYAKQNTGAKNMLNLSKYREGKVQIEASGYNLEKNKDNRNPQKAK